MSYPVCRFYKGKQVISVPVNSHADGNSQRHMEISSLFGSRIADQKYDYSGDKTSKMRDVVICRVAHVHEEPKSQALNYYQCQYESEQPAHQVEQNPGP